MKAPPLQIPMLVILTLLMWPFVLYAVNFGQGGLRDALPEPHYIRSQSSSANTAIFSHMLTGAAITLLVPLQLISPLRRRAPAFHRWTGRILIALAVVTALGGLIYIAERRTIGGWPMDIGFTIYGLLLLITTVQTFRHARARRFAQHYAWALRFFWLAIASWLYRVHYGLWYLLTDGLWSRPDFTGAFDLAQNFAFYLPYLIGVEFWLRQKRRPALI